MPRKINEKNVFAMLDPKAGENTPKPKRKETQDPKSNIRVNKTYSFALDQVEELDRLAFWSRNKMSELVDKAISDLIQKVKKNPDYIDMGGEAMEYTEGEKLPKIKQLPKSEQEKRKKRTVGRPKK